MQDGHRQYEIGFLLVPDFPLMALSSALEVLRHANRFCGYPRYLYKTYGSGAGIVTASNGLAVQSAADLTEGARPDFMFVCCGLHPEAERDPHMLAWLRLMSRRGTVMGGISAGQFILARAGLLEGYDCAVHWEYAAAFHETFPDVKLNDRLYVVDRDRYTCSGGAATLDMFLHLVSNDAGPEVAARAAEQMLVERVRSTADRQASAALFKAKACSRALAAAIEQMETHIDAPLSMMDLAEHVGLTRRQLHRLFRQHTGETPTDFYRDLRLRHARNLLKQTPAKIIDVALAAGFGSHSHFTKVYRERYGVSPLKDRRDIF